MKDSLDPSAFIATSCTKSSAAARFLVRAIAHIRILGRKAVSRSWNSHDDESDIIVSLFLTRDVSADESGGKMRRIGVAYLAHAVVLNDCVRCGSAEHVVFSPWPARHDDSKPECSFGL
jgi:hypothetical protein